MLHDDEREGDLLITLLFHNLLIIAPSIKAKLLDSSSRVVPAFTKIQLRQ